MPNAHEDKMIPDSFPCSSYSGRTESLGRQSGWRGTGQLVLYLLHFNSFSRKALWPREREREKERESPAFTPLRLKQLHTGVFQSRLYSTHINSTETLAVKLHIKSRCCYLRAYVCKLAATITITILLHK